jgi:lipid A 3-O-deacylase
MKRSIVFFTATLGWLFAAAMVSAQSQPAPDLRTDVRSPFSRGVFELQLAGGYAFSQNFHDVFRPQMNDIDGTARLGWMLTDPIFEGTFRGNIELMGEVFGGGFVKGPADALGGVTLFFQYNFVQPERKFVPYFHVGGGGVYSDASDSQPQRELGSPSLFNVQVGFGTRFLCTQRWGLFLETNWRHLSNAGLADRNRGLNSVSSWFGVSFFF